MQPRGYGTPGCFPNQGNHLSALHWERGSLSHWTTSEAPIYGYSYHTGLTMSQISLGVFRDNEELLVQLLCQSLQFKATILAFWNNNQALCLEAVLSSVFFFQPETSPSQLVLVSKLEIGNC